MVLANGDPTGYGLHGDFMNGWDRSVLSRAVETCTAESGVIEDCPVFNNENRFFPSGVNDECAASNPIPLEDFDPGVILPNLPGCVAITEGPAPAVDGDYVPGCTAAGVNGGGNATAASSGVPSGAAASTAPGTPAASSSGTSGSSVADDSPVSALKFPLPSVTSGASSLPSQPANGLVASAPPSVSASTFTTELGALLSILQGASSVVPTPTANPASASPSMPMPMSMLMDPNTTNPTTSPVPSGNGKGKGKKKGGSSSHCGRSYPGDVTDSHRRGRMMRRHGSSLFD